MKIEEKYKLYCFLGIVDSLLFSEGQDWRSVYNEVMLLANRIDNENRSLFIQELEKNSRCLKNIVIFLDKRIKNEWYLR